MADIRTSRWKAALLAGAMAFVLSAQRPVVALEQAGTPTPTPTPSPAPQPAASPTPSPTPLHFPVPQKPLVVPAPSATPTPTPTPTNQQAQPGAATVPTPSPTPLHYPVPQQPLVVPAPSPTPPQPGAATVANQEEIVFVAVGDVMLGTTFPDETGGDLPPNDGADLLQEVAPILKKGDVTFGNLEGPLVDSGVSAKCRGKREGTCYAFRVPTRYAKYLKEAGFTVMGLANNHAMDFGAEGRASSRQALEQVGIAHTGEVGDIARLTAKAKKIDVIAFATYPNANNLLDLDDALQTIRNARQEADIVIVSFHGGAEGASHQHVPNGDETFLGEDRGDLRKFAHAAIDAGAQVVVGSGPHVVRGMEVYQGKLIAYSLGNFATYGPFNLSGESGLSLILEAHLGPDGSFLGGHAYPVKQQKPGGPKMDGGMAILPILSQLCTSDFGQNGINVGDDGSLEAPKKANLTTDQH